MNMQLALANAAVDAADRKWRAHKLYCSQCSTAQRRRRPPEMCAGGRPLYDDLKACQADLANERLLAKQPMPGQRELFPELAR